VDVLPGAVSRAGRHTHYSVFFDVLNSGRGSAGVFLIPDLSGIGSVIYRSTTADVQLW
jgi:hypothetical protein